MLHLTQHREILNDASDSLSEYFPLLPVMHLKIPHSLILTVLLVLLQQLKGHALDSAISPLLGYQEDGVQLCNYSITSFCFLMELVKSFHFSKYSLNSVSCNSVCSIINM